MYPKNIPFQKGHLCGCMSTMWLTNTHYLTWMLSGRSWWWFQNMKIGKTCLHIHRCAKGTILFDRPGQKKTPDVAVLRRQSFQLFLFLIFSDDASFAGRPMPAKRPWCSQFSQRFNSLSFTFFSLVNCIVKLHALSNPRRGSTHLLLCQVLGPLSEEEVVQSNRFIKLLYNFMVDGKPGKGQQEFEGWLPSTGNKTVDVGGV